MTFVFPNFVGMMFFSLVSDPEKYILHSLPYSYPLLWTIVILFIYSNWLISFFILTFDWLRCYSCPDFSPFASPHPAHHTPSGSLRQSPHHCSCPWVMHISSLATPFPVLFFFSPPVLFLISLCLLCTYQFVLLNPCTFSPILPLHLPTDNPPCDLHYCDSVLVVCLVFVLFFRFSCW